jgi:nucleotide-binding universal stress UspA family protein
MTHPPIIVPLDGSELAERALPYARTLATALRAPVVLVTAIGGTDVREELARSLRLQESERGYFSAYLETVADRLALSGTETAVHVGDAADVILNTANEYRGQMIIASSHGRSGLGRWMYGSVAAALVRSSTVPLLLVGKEVAATGQDRVPIRSMMVPLDGSPTAEVALKPAKQLAQALEASLTLVRAVPWAADRYVYLPPYPYSEGMEAELENAGRAYLERVRRDADMEMDIAVVRGQPADALLTYVAEHGVDVVVMTTHARSGLARLALGSTADRMLHGKAPVLLIPPSYVRKRAQRVGIEASSAG